MAAVLAAMVVWVSPVRAQGDEEAHGRKYKPPPVTSRLEITVLRGSSGKPIPNAAVIFHTVTNGDDGNMEMKTGPDGKAVIEIIPTGSTVGLQIIADGFATYGDSFVLSQPKVSRTVRMEKPKAQVSTYTTKDEPGLDRGIGVREPIRTKVDTTPTVLKSGQPVINLGGGTGGATLSGRIIGPRGAPVGGAVIQLVPTSEGTKTLTAKTTDDGMYALVHVPAGKYKMLVNANGFIAKTNDDVVLTEAQSQVVNTTLSEKR